MTVIYAALSVAILYFLFAFGGKAVEKLVGRKICAICAAVSLTWVGLLVFRWFGYAVDPLVIAILMGESVVGLMVKLEEYFEERELSRFWAVRILVVAGGPVLIYALIRANYRLLLYSLVGAALLLFVWFLVSGKGAGERKRAEGYGEAVSKLEKMMEECC